MSQAAAHCVQPPPPRESARPSPSSPTDITSIKRTIRQTAFTSNRDDDYEIYTVRPNGKRLARLTHSPGNDAHPAWSPDGQWLVFASNRTGFKDETGGMSDGEIFVMRADGSDLRQLTENTFEDGAPAWRPPPPPTRAERKAERESERR